MYSLQDLETEIINLIERQKYEGARIIPADWVAQAVMASHPSISGDDSDFYTVCSYRTVRETTRRVMSKYRKNEIETSQVTLDGFEMLQTHYVIAHKDQHGEDAQVMKHVDEMTYDELTAKAIEHERVGLAHLKHRDELYRFRDSKFNGRAPMANAA